MKQFQYRLETVLDYKTQVLDNLKSEHAVIIQSVNRKQEEIQGLHQELNGIESEFDRTTGYLICASAAWRRSLMRKKNG